jgi:hypothetical protein
MATIAEIREKYPQYSDMPDAALADALHGKFYSDMPKTDFYAKVGLIAAPVAGGKQYGSAVPSATPTYPDAIPNERVSVRDVLGGIVETPLALGTSIVAGAVAPIAGVVRSVTGGQYGTQEGVRQGAELAGRVQRALTYQPQTRGGQAAMETIGEVAEPLAAIPFSQGATAAVLAPSAIRQAGNIARTEANYLKNVVADTPFAVPNALRQAGNIARTEAEYLKSAVSQIPAVKAAGEARVAESNLRAPQIDAANLAQKYNIALDPAVSNPTARNKARSAIVGSTDLDVRLATANEPKWTAAVKKDFGLGDNAQLTNPKVFDDLRARDDISGPYKVVQDIPSIRVSEDALSKIDELRVTPLYGDMGQAATTNTFLDTVKTQLQQGGDGAKLLKSIQQMRQEGKDVLRAGRAGNPIDPVARAAAEVKMKTAKVLESMIDDNIPDIKAREAFIKARQKMAQTYDVESATNFGTGRVDPRVFGKMVSEGEPVSGIVAELGKIAAVYPEISVIGANAKTAIPRLSRGAPLALAGSVIGGALGNVPGAAAGLAVGAGANELIRQILAKRMTSPSFQSSRAVPKDYRPKQPTNNLTPENRNNLRP